MSLIGPTTSAKIRMRCRLLGALATALLFKSILTPVDAERRPYYRLTDLGTLGGQQSAAMGINREGLVVGYSATANGSTHGFLYTGGTLIDLGTLGGPTSVAYRISDTNPIVGRSETSLGIQRPFVSVKGGPLFDLGRFGTALGGSFSAALGVNGKGKVVGYLLTQGDHMSARTRVFSYRDYEVLDQGTFGGEDGVVTAINEQDEVVGYYSTEPHADYAHHQGFRLKDGEPITLGSLGGQIVTPTDINEAGTVVGYAQQNGGQFHAFRSTVSAGMKDLGTLDGGRQSFAYGINRAGVIVGASEAGGRALHAVVIVDGRMLDLNTLLVLPDWVLTEARDINDANEIVGIGFVRGQQRGFLLRNQ
jgi:probable HAF family extracellular repeat protein